MKRVSFPLQQGQTSKQAHCDLPEGSYEREIGREGFFGPVSHMYHRHAPTSWSAIQGPLRPHCFILPSLNAETLLPWRAPLLLENTQLAIHYWRCSATMTQLARNGDGDTLLFTHKGQGDLYCDYGYMRYTEGDYILIPRGCTWRIDPEQHSEFLVIEARDSALQLPDKSLLGPTAIFDAAALDYPRINDEFIAQQSEDPWQVVIKRLGQETVMHFDFNPLDALGWHGDNTVIKINWRDLRPVMSHRYHLPPSAHTSFVGQGFVVCTFCPRPVESDSGALKVPFYHSNDDYDEVLFYHAGNFFSRDNINAGYMTLHPSGFAHGPHPKALQKSYTEPRTFLDEVAVMIDCRQALQVMPAAESVEEPQYVNSWKVDSEVK